MASITILFIFVPILVAILLIANVLLAPNDPYSEKVSQYECGYNTVEGQTRAPFNIQYYLVGILFLLFDLEVLVIYPIASTLSETGILGFWIFILFTCVLTIGFVVEIAQGVLYFTDQRSAITPKH